MNSVEPSTWPHRRLGDLFRLKHGYAFKGQYFAGAGKYVLLTPGNFIPEGGIKLKGEKEKYYTGEFPEGFLLRQSDLLVAMTDLKQDAPILGSAAFVPESNRFLHNQRLGKVVDLRADEITRRFLYYVFNSPYVRNQIKASATGATVRHTAPERIYSVEIRLPRVETQSKITSILSAYDDLIENNLRRIKILEEMAQALYREWFVKFRFPGHEKVRMVESSLGEIPEGWEVVRARGLLEKTIGGGWGKDVRTADHDCLVNVIRGTDFKDLRVGNYDDVPKRYVKDSQLKTRRLEPGDLIIENSVNASSRCVGTPFLVSEGVLARLKGDSICASFCKMFRPKSQEYGDLLFLHMRHLLDEGKMEYYQNVAANGIGNFQAERFVSDESIPVPTDVPMFSKLLEYIRPLLTTTNSERIAVLRHTRDLLLPKLISGDLDVSNLDIPIPEEAA